MTYFYIKKFNWMNKNYLQNVKMATGTWNIKFICLYNNTILK